MVAALALAVVFQQLDLSHLVGKTLDWEAKSEANADALFKIIRERFTGEHLRQFPGQTSVLRYGDEFLTITDIPNGIVFGLDNPNKLYFCWFSRDQKLEAGFQFMPNVRCAQYSLTSEPGIPNQVLRMQDWGPDGDEEYVGFVDRRPAGIQMLKKRATPFDPPWVAFSPPPQSENIAQALRGSNTVETLEAVQWFSEWHPIPSVKGPNYAEPRADILRYWQSLLSPAVQKELSRLTSSSQPWIADGAKRAIAIPRPLIAASSSDDRIATFKTDDITVGHGTEWQSAGEILDDPYYGVFELSAHLPSGRKVDLHSAPGSLTEIQAGSPYEIEGLQRGLIGMRPGGERRLTLPASMAFGDVGADEVPADAGLIVDAKLLYIEGKPQSRPRDLKVGTGRVARVGDLADFTWTTETLDGKPAGIPDEQSATSQYVLNGVSRVVVGMKPGGVRRALLEHGAVVQVRLDRVWPGPDTR